MPFDFAVRNGIELVGQARPEKYAEGFPKYCFGNSISLVRRHRGLIYMEGYAYDTKIDFYFNHAWAVNKANQVIDVTLSDPTKYQYLGVKISNKDYRKYTTKYSSSVFDTGRGMNIKFFLDNDPTLIEHIPEEIRSKIVQSS